MEEGAAPGEEGSDVEEGGELGEEGSGVEGGVEAGEEGCASRFRDPKPTRLLSPSNTVYTFFKKGSPTSHWVGPKVWRPMMLVVHQVSFFLRAR